MTDRDKRAITGWNEYVHEAHSIAREAFQSWRQLGKPKHGVTADIMRSTRANFKYALRACKRQNERRESDKLAKKLMSKCSNDFWREIKKIQNDKPQLGLKLP